MMSRRENALTHMITGFLQHLIDVGVIQAPDSGDIAVEWDDLLATSDEDKLEVDGVLEARDGRVAAIEVKAGATVTARDFRGMRWLAKRMGERFTTGVVLYAGDESLRFGPGLWAVPISALWT